MELQNIYVNVCQGSNLIPIIVGTIYYKALTRPFKILFYFFITSVLFEIQALVTIQIFHTNLPGLYLFTLTEFLVFSTVFYLHAQKNSTARLLIVINAIVFISLTIVEVINNRMKIPNDLSRGYSYTCLIVYTLFYFYHLFTTEDIRYMREYPMFWLCVALFIYSALNVLYFMERSILVTKYPKVERVYDLFHATLAMISNCLVAKSFICIRKFKAAL